MSEVTSPIILDSTGQDIADALTDVADAINAGNATAAMLAYVENGSTATQPYVKGTYICWKSLLYTADTAINAGDAFSSTGANKNLTAVGGGGFNALAQFGLSKTNPSLTSPNCNIAVKLKYTIFGKIVIYEFAITPTSNIPYNTYFLYGLDNASAGMNQIGGMLTDTGTGGIKGIRMSGGNILCNENLSSGVSYRGIILYSID